MSLIGPLPLRVFDPENATLDMHLPPPPFAGSSAYHV